MTISAQSIVFRASTILLDLTAIRWSANELVQWLNDGQREIISLRPDANTQYIACTLAAGTRQSLDTIAETSTLKPFKLMDIIRNTASSSLKEAVRQINRDIMDAQYPGWHGATQAVDIKHFMFDNRAPKSFYVYPPATTAAQVEALVSLYPTDIATPSGTDYTTVSGNILLGDIFAQALIDYILYRAFMKDSDYAGNIQRATAYYSAFTNLLGTEIKGTMSVAPGIPQSTNPAAPTE